MLTMTWERAPVARSSTGSRHRAVSGRRAIAVVLAVGAVLLAACSSGTSSSSGTTTTSAHTSSGLTTGLGNAGGGQLAQQANDIAKTSLTGPEGTGLTRGVTSSTITVGCVTTAIDYTGYQQGIEARFARANKAGIDGRKLDLLPCKDDANSTQTNVSETQQLVNQNQVFSVLTLSEFALPGSTNFLNANQVPYFGWGFNAGFCGTRWGFGWNGCLGGNAFSEPIEAIAGNLAEAIIKASGLKASQVRFAVQAESSPSGQIGNGQYEALFKALGAKVVYAEANYPPNASGVDNTPYVQAITASNPNIVYISTAFSNVGPLAAALKAAGYKGVIMDFTNYIPGLLAASPQLASALQGQYVNTQVVPNEQNTGWVQQEQADLAGIGLPRFVTLGGAIGYAEATQLVEMLEAVGKNLTTKTFDETVNGGKVVSYSNMSGAGGPGELIWPAAHYLPADCAAIVRVSGTNFQVVEPFSCYQSFKVTK